MKHFLFVISAIIFLLPLFVTSVFAQVPTSPAPTPYGDWVQDSSVTFTGKSVNRAKDFMDWTLTNYKWDYVDDSIMSGWKSVRNIVYTISILAILVAAFFIIVNGGRNFGILLFSKEFITALVVITFSFALLHLLYQAVDIFESFFYQTAGTGTGVIVAKDIMNISFPSKDFIGYRRVGVGFDESAYLSLLLIRVSSVTFYVMGCVLTIRKVLLWFFLISSPLLPLILLFKPVRVTAKVWISEFIRWLFYGPLFAVFLAATVIIWKSNLLILPFNFNSASPPLYPTAISILAGGPGQQLSLTNSLNYNDTYIQYVISLIMLWVVILLPFLLLQIVLDFLAKHDYGVEYINSLQAKIGNNGFAFLKKSPQPETPPAGHSPAGLARKIQNHTVIEEETNINKKVSTSSEERSARQQSTYMSHLQADINATPAASTQSGKLFRKQSAPDQVPRSDVTNLTQSYSQTTRVAQSPDITAQFKPEVTSRPTTRLLNFPIPTMRDIVKFETARLNRVQTNTSQLQQTQQTLSKIADPQTSSTPAEEQHFTNLREQLNQETTRGDVLAKSVLTAASTVQKSEESKIGETPVAGIPQQSPTISFPVVNQIQTVSFDDYEAVKALWLENYQQIDVPENYPDRRSWIEEDGKAVSQAITLLSSPDPVKVQEGLSSVSDILPFLLIGGFSQTEVIAYLKAKRAAEKLALEQLGQKEEEQETLLKKGAKKAKLKHLSEEAELGKKAEIN
jgi:hypothetical protein